MRPKRVVLYVDGNPETLSIRKFLFETRGYICKTASTPDDAMDLVKSSKPDVLVVNQELEGGGHTLIKRVKACNLDLRTILISEVIRPGELAHQADCFLGKNYFSHADLIQRTKIFAAKKRGPKSVFQVFPEESVG